MKNIFKTPNNNHYLYHPGENKTMFLHPLIVFFSQLEDQGVNALEWVRGQQTPRVTINGLGEFTQEEIIRYFKKYNLLKEKNYFSAGNADERLFQRRLTPHDFENLITLCGDVTFEITKNCNLDCHYCIQGDVYQIHEKDQQKNVDIQKAKRLLDYLRSYWNRPLSPKLIGIKFYGGEPLMNFDAVKEIIEYTKTLKTETGKDFYYYMTTNGVLLDKHLDYLAANDVYVAVSLDGGKENNSHRVFPNGKQSFDKITQNINFIRDNHPAFFEKNISFQSVLHNRNSITQIHQYFGKTYQKHPSMTEMTRVGINEDKRSDFEDMQAKIYESLYHGNDYPLLKDTRLKDLPKTPGSGIISHNAYNWLLKNPGESKDTYINKTPTGTCHPFSKGIFMATDGKILPCERIEHKHALGYVDTEVHLDFEEMARTLNRYYDKINWLCHTCANAKSCQKCLFNCKIDEARPTCNLYCSPKDFLKELSDNIGYMEDKPEIYCKHLREI